MAYNTATWPSPHAIALTRFTNDGYPEWIHSLPTSVKIRQIQNYINLCIPSISIAQAFLDPCDGTERASADELRSSHAPTAIVCDDGVAVVAIRPKRNVSHWYALIGPKFAFPGDHEVFITTMLPAFEEVAHILMMQEASQCDDPLQCLFQSMCRNLSSDQEWGTGRWTPHLCRTSLINLAKLIKKNPQSINQNTELRESLPFRRSVENFVNAIEKMWSSSKYTFCIITPHLNIAYADNNDEIFASRLLWYYENILNLGRRVSLCDFSELSPCGIARFCYKARDWILLGQTFARAKGSSKDAAAMRDAAREVITLASSGPLSDETPSLFNGLLDKS